MLRYVVAVLLLAGGIKTDLMEGIGPCPNNIPLPLEVYVYGCPYLPCDVFNGDTVYFEMNFLVNRPTGSLTPRASIVLGQLEVPSPIEPEDLDGCGGLIGDISCPLYQGDIPRYGLGMRVESPISGVTINLQFMLVDDFDLPVVCYRRNQTISAPNLFGEQ